MNLLYHSDNLVILRHYIPDESELARVDATFKKAARCRAEPVRKAMEFG